MHLCTEMKTLRDMYTEFYIENMRTSEQYLHELELLIHFQLLIVLSSFSSKVNEIMFHNNLIVTKSYELKAFGIYFTLGDGGKTLAEKHSHITREIERLDHLHRMRFENIKEEYVIELEEQRKIQKQKAAEEQKALEERMKLMKSRHEEHQQKVQEQAKMTNVPIDEMVDSVEKFKKIIEQFKATGEKFVDKQFPANDSSLGSHTISNTKGWKRAEGLSIYDGKVTANNVRQGAIGDCYFLSAISVLGNKRLMDMFIETNPDPKCGAYLMKFFRYGDPIYVIVDEFFPINEEGKWAFAQTENGTEL